MKHQTLPCLVAWFAFAALHVASESISASGLLGSHFGVPGVSATYDYVVIGGGTAGLTVARRLAANASGTVAVIEAGDFYEFSNGNLSEVPAFATQFTGNDPVQKNPYLDWYMYTEPQASLGGRRALYDSGKVLGGTTEARLSGTIGTFDKWAEQVGDDSYKFSNFLPYFQRSARFHPPDTGRRPSNATARYNASDWDSSGGPLQVGYSSWVNPVSSWLGLAFKELGLRELPSLLSGTLLGWSWLSVTLDPATQTRSSSESFLRVAIEENSNLVVYKSTIAKKIVFEDCSAKSVIVDSGGAIYNISANKEIVLSAGVMRSPQMLMVSGIGQRELLTELGINVVADLPGVGQNMWDNVLVGPSFEIDLTTHSSLLDREILARAIQEYNSNRTGILTNTCSLDNPNIRMNIGFEKLNETTLSSATYQSLKENFPDDWPHIEYLVLDAYFGAGTDSSISAGRTPQYVAASVGLVATFSRGNVTINSTDSANNPVISPNWLSDPRDQDIALAAFKRGRQLFSTNVIKPVVRTEAFPGSNIDTNAQILDVIRSSANSVYNAAGTNQMGKADNPMSVADSHGRVRGVNRLRVVDASLFPFLPPGQPSATVYALAEKIAEDMLHGG
ncbi:MAG: hypothetical protein LQ342_008001 [Letrouitia transgressa]|nr:MAG: hypothetical protein LQ342_008001 [Letrouitia transgressa]